MGVRNFRSAKGYKKWLAFGHIHGVFKAKKGNQMILIRGKRHKVIHSKI